MNVQYAQSYGNGKPVVPIPENNGNSIIQGPSSHRGNVPRHNSSKSESDGCCGCLCWCCCFLLLFMFGMAGVLIYTVISLDPKPPSYKFNHIEVRKFEFGNEFSLHTQIAITVEAENPNRNIGIFYGNDSMVAMVYRGTILSLGNLPVFYQDKENSTMFDVVLEGVTSFGYGLHSKLVEDSNSGQIPLIIFIKVPVVLQAWAMDTKELTVYIQCNLVVDSLQSDKKVDIISAKYRYNVKF